MANTMKTSTDMYSFCKVCRLNHTQKRNHIFTNRHKQKLKTILKKFGMKIKLCRPYLENPVIQEGECEPDSMFWCHCCTNNFNKHVTDRLKSIINGGVLEHLASDEHCHSVELFWHENGAEQKFKASFIVSKTDFDLYKQQLIPLVNKYDTMKDKQTAVIAQDIKSKESQRFLTNIQSFSDSSTASSARTIFRTVRNKDGILQNPSGYHDNVRVWKGGIVKYKQGCDQIIQSKYKHSPSNRVTSNKSVVYTVSAESQGLTKVDIKPNKLQGNIHSGATPPWLRTDSDNTISGEGLIAGPSEDEFRKYIKKQNKSKLNPNRVGANFDHSNQETDWLPSFGRVWNQGARWKSRQEYQKEVCPKKKMFKKHE